MTTPETSLAWCVEARKKLKLGALKRDTLKIPDRARAVKKSLESARARISPQNAGELQSVLDKEKEFSEISQRLMAMGEKQQLAQMKVEAQRLEVLAAEIELLAVPAKSKDKAEKQLEKAKAGVAERQNQYKERYLVQLARAKDELQQLNAIKFADAAALAKQIDDAKALTASAGREDFTAASDFLAGSTAAFESAKAKAGKLQEEELRNTAQKPHYESKVRKINEVIEELEKVPGTESYVIQLKGALQLGARAIQRTPSNPLDTDLFDAGYAAIVRLAPSTSRVRANALKAAAAARRASSKDAEASSAESAARKALTGLSTPKELVRQDRIVKLSEQIASASLICGTSDRAKGLNKLAEIKRAIDEDKLKLVSLHDACEQSLAEAVRARDDLLYAATDEDRAVLREPASRLQLATTLFAALEFEEAEQLLSTLLPELRGLVSKSDRTPDKLEQKWTGMADALKEAQSEVGLLKARRERLGLPVPFVAQMQRVLDNLEASASRDWNEAIARLQAIAADVKRGLRELDQYEASSESRGAEADKVTPMMERAQTALGRMEIALRSKGDSGASALELAREQLADAEKQWKERLASATDASRLDAPGARSRFEALAARFQHSAESPDALDVAVAEGQRHALVKRLDAAVRGMESLLDSLRAASAQVASPFAKELAAIRKQAGMSADLDAPDGPLAKLSVLERSIKTAMTEQETALSEAARTAKARYEEVGREIKALSIQADKSLRVHNRGVFEPFFESLREELRNLRGMVESTSVSVALAAMPELDLLSRRTRQLAEEMRAEPAKGDESKAIAEGLLAKETVDEEAEEFGLVALFDNDPKPNFRLVMEAIRSIDKSLGDKNLGSCMPEHKLRLKAEFEKLREDIHGLPPVEAFAKLKSFHEDLRGVLARALDASNLRSNFHNLFKEVRGRFVELGGIEIGSLRGRLEKLRKEPTAYRKELENRLLAAQAMVGEPQKEQRAMSELLKIRGEIMRVLEDQTKDDPTLLAKKEKEAQDRAFQREKEAAHWSALVRDFKQMDYQRARAAIDGTPGSEKSQARDLDRLLKQAEDFFRDSSNFIGAVELLNNAKQYAKRIQTHPLGLKAASRDQLPKVRAHWKSAVADFNTSVSTMVDGIDRAVKAAPSPVAEQVKDAAEASRKMLESLRTLFNADIMDGPIAVMTGSAPKADQRSARETAMRHVNRYRELLRTDPVLLKLMDGKRPFGTVDFYGLNAALRDLDLNIQRAV